jgi:uncharacterized membrane protein
MTFMRFLGLILGLVFVTTYGYILLSKHLLALGSFIGFTVGLLFLLYGINGKDFVQMLFKKLTSRSFSNGN